MGYVQYRVSRVTREGSVYTISPRLIVPRNSVEMPKDITRRFWLTVRVPQDAVPGVYRGTVRIASPQADALSLPLEFTVRKGSLDPVDIPAGPWGHTINLPLNGDEAAMRAAGFSDYSEFLKALFGAVQTHADQAGWLPVYWNVGDEPLGDDLTRSGRPPPARGRQ